MTPVLPDAPVEAAVGRFRAALAARIGLDFEDAKLGFLAEVLRRRLGERGVGVTRYCESLEREASPAELGALADELTVGETYFFRNHDQFRALTEVCLPARISDQAHRRRLRVLSAGCASGEEAYSLAIALREFDLDGSWDVAVHAIDASPAALRRAERARYSSWSLRETTAEQRRRWFTSDGNEAALDPAVRAGVRFEQANLADPMAPLWQVEPFDVVFCRNVLMYFVPAAARAAIERITQVLVPGGYLFLGHAETLRGLSPEFHLCHTHETFYYQRRSGPLGAMTASTAARGSLGVTGVASRATPGPVADQSWVEVIKGATARIQALTGGQRPPIASLAPPRAELGGVLTLLAEERFAAALDQLEALPAAAADDPDRMLLQAALLTHGGQLGAAERVCRTLLERDGMSAGAHYLLALCREALGDRGAAVDHDQVAAYLDPGFAMPRLHLGLMARRDGDPVTARRELEQALLLLEHEDTARILLFGGGFGRDSLRALCRGELAACAGVR
ncbi:MAG: protein-glutamate O-methyltransferase CheR [Deltaproteobacteria bacterium]|nr:protein-glutamate O-methyltransferase CheR [Deltaproteobacteria bacterium]